MRKPPSLRMPPSRTLDLSRFQGVENLPDPANIAPPWLALAENVVLERGTVAVRPGLSTAAALTGVSPFSGIGVWRDVASTSPDLAPEDVEQREMLVTFPINDSNNHPCLGAAWMDLNVPGTFLPITPLADNGDGLLLGADRDVYFAQLKNILYAVNGYDGLFWYNTAEAVHTISLAQGLPQMMAPAPTGAWGSLTPAAGFNWQSSDGTKFAANATLNSDMMHRLSHPPGIDRSVIKEGDTLLDLVAGSTGKRVYHVYSQPLDLTTDAYKSDNLMIGVYMEAETNFTPFTALRLVLGKTIGGDNTTDPTNAAFAPTAANSIQFDLYVSYNYAWEFIRLPINDLLQSSILSGVDYIAFVAVNQRGSTSATPSIGSTSLPVPDTYSILVSDVVAPGVLPSSPTYYVQRAYNSELGSAGPISDPGRIDLYDFPTGRIDTLPVADEQRRVSLVVDFTNLPTEADTVLVYRSVPDPANTDPASLPYYQVVAVTRAMAAADADGNPHTYTFLDNAKEGDILTNDQPTDIEAPVPSGAGDAPWFILGKDTRLLLFRSIDEPEGMWASDIDHPASVPSIPFEDQTLNGKGGFVRCGSQDGDEIMGACRRSNEVLVFKRRSVYAWTFLAEGTDQETWKVDRLTQPGTESTHSICQVPGGVVWLSTDGLYFLPDDSDVATPFPVSLSIQQTFNTLSPTDRKKVCCAYWPLHGWLVVGLPGQREMLVCDLRQKAEGHPLGVWVGTFLAQTPDGSGQLSPGLLFAETDDLYVARGDTGTLDRFNKPWDTDPYTDYGGAINLRVQTGWLEPLGGRKLRLVRRNLLFTFDGEGAAAGAAIAALLTLETRPNGDSQVYLVNQTFTPDGTPAGLLETGAAGDDVVHASLVGQQLRVTLSASTQGPYPVRLLSLRLAFVEVGLWKG